MISRGSPWGGSSGPICGGTCRSLITKHGSPTGRHCDAFLTSFLTRSGSLGVDSLFSNGYTRRFNFRLFGYALTKWSDCVSGDLCSSSSNFNSRSWSTNCGWAIETTFGDSWFSGASSNSCDKTDYSPTSRIFRYQRAEGTVFYS